MAEGLGARFTDLHYVVRLPPWTGSRAKFADVGKRLKRTNICLRWIHDKCM